MSRGGSRADSWRLAVVTSISSGKLTCSNVSCVPQREQKDRAPFLVELKRAGVPLTIRKPLALDAKPRDERCSRGPAANRAMTVCLMKRRAVCFVTDRATETSTREHRSPLRGHPSMLPSLTTIASPPIAAAASCPFRTVIDRPMRLGRLIYLQSTAPLKVGFAIDSPLEGKGFERRSPNRNGRPLSEGLLAGLIATTSAPPSDRGV